MSRAGVASDHAERCLGHVIGGVRGVYDRHQYREEMLLAYERLAALIAQIVDPQPNVVRSGTLITSSRSVPRLSQFRMTQANHRIGLVRIALCNLNGEQSRSSERTEMQSTDLELLDRRAVCSLFGGIHPSTLYRHVRTGTISRPIKVGALSRWLKSECKPPWRR